ncbi:MAG: hypothetical protein LBL13_04760 [Bacteroidales bacterium]|jgi:hypothetical protein|nr:hypothetical protein [Bacteroidales bacterium]
MKLSNIPNGMQYDVMVYFATERIIPTECRDANLYNIQYTKPTAQSTKHDKTIFKFDKAISKSDKTIFKHDKTISKSDKTTTT